MLELWSEIFIFPHFLQAICLIVKNKSITVSKNHNYIIIFTNSYSFTAQNAKKQKKDKVSSYLLENLRWWPRKPGRAFGFSSYFCLKKGLEWSVRCFFIIWTRLEGLCSRKNLIGVRFSQNELIFFKVSPYFPAYSKHLLL